MIKIHSARLAICCVLICLLDASLAQAKSPRIRAPHPDEFCSDCTSSIPDTTMSFINTSSEDVRCELFNYHKFSKEVIIPKGYDYSQDFFRGFELKCDGVSNGEFFDEFHAGRYVIERGYDGHLELVEVFPHN